MLSPYANDYILVRRDAIAEESKTPVVVSEHDTPVCPVIAAPSISLASPNGSRAMIMSRAASARASRRGKARASGGGGKSKTNATHAPHITPKRGLNGDFAVVPRQLRPTKYYLSLHNSGTLTASSGTINAVIASSPASCVDWSSVSGSFQEFRTLRITVTAVPINRYISTSTFTAQIYVANDYQANAALLSEASAISYVDALSFCSLADPWEHVIVAPDYPPYNNLMSTQAPTDMMWIKTFAPNLLPAGGSYAKLLIRYDLELVGQT